MVSLHILGTITAARLVNIRHLIYRQKEKSKKIVYVIKTLGLYSQLSFITYSSINNIYHVLFIFLVLIYLIPGTLYVGPPSSNAQSFFPLLTSPPLEPQTHLFLVYLCVCVFCLDLCVNEIILLFVFSL